MPCIHKTFYGFRTVFLYIFAILLCAQSAHAANPLFTIEDVKVDITAVSAVAARAQAFDKAQVDAFQTLAERMLSASDLAQFKAPDVDTISTMIQDYEISDERLSSVRYVASYKIRFRDDAVARYFANSNVAYTAVSANPALVLPFLRKDGKTMLWSPYNNWKEAWDRAGDVSSGVVPLLVPLGDIADVRDIGDESAMDYNNTNLNQILERYSASEAIILIAEPDATLSRVQNASDAAVGNLAVQIYRTDRGRPEYVQQVDVLAGGTDTLANVMDRAVTSVRGALKSNWKSQIAESPMAAASHIEARVAYTSLKEWAETQSALRRAYGVRDIKIRSVTPNEARVELGYEGDVNRLSLGLSQSGLTLEPPQGAGQGGYGNAAAGTNDSFSYYASANAGVSAGGVYNLYLNKYRR